jgi:anti-anti-sigma regulatory factor/anti-sigma regulatory factor (Ser/Thr protein kinase)
MFDPLVQRMIAKKAADRFPDMNHVLDELNRLEVSSLSRPSTSIHYFDSNRAVYEEPETITDFCQLAGLRKRHEDQGERKLTRIQLLGAKSMAILPDTGWSALVREDFQVLGLFEQSMEIDREVQDAIDLWVLGVDEQRWDVSWQKWMKKGIPAEKILVCIDASLDSPLLKNITDFPTNVLIGPHPLDPSVMSSALSWLSWNESGGIKCFLPSEACQMLQITSSSKKATYIDQLLDAARAEGVRQRALRALAELAEEMIMNAIFHAPIDENGQPRYAHLSRETEVVLPAGEEPVLSWLIGKRYIAVSIRDPFGSLSPQEIFNRISGKDCIANLNETMEGAGVGLRIMSRSAQHLVFTICPGNWCEVLALVSQKPLSTSGDHSLCVLQSVGHHANQIGQHLMFKSRKHQEGVTLIELKGRIDGTSDLRPLFSESGTVHIDLRGITEMDAAGTEKWLNEASRSRSDIELILERCSMPVVQQFNKSPRLYRSCTVASIIAPYYCPHCKHQMLEMVQLNDLPFEKLPPHRQCSKCHRELEFDEFPGEYFAFLFPKAKELRVQGLCH